MVASITAGPKAGVIGCLKPGQQSFRSADDLEVFRRHFAALAIGEEFEADLLAFIQAAQASALNSADVYESVGFTVIGGDEPETLLTVEPLNCSLGHTNIFQKTLVIAARELAGRRNRTVCTAVKSPERIHAKSHDWRIDRADMSRSAARCKTCWIDSGECFRDPAGMTVI